MRQLRGRSALCHTGNISVRLGAKKNPNEIKEAMKDHKGMVESWDRMVEHLGKNNVDITKEKVTLGVPLKMDGKTEKFLGNEKANELLTRNYRAPLQVGGRHLVNRTVAGCDVANRAFVTGPAIVVHSRTPAQ